MIPIEECKDGYTYKILSRNLGVGVFEEKTGGFVGIREKFGNKFLFTEFHRDTGAPYGTVSPERELDKCPIEDRRESLGARCLACKKPVQFDKPKADGGKGWHGCDCDDPYACSTINKPLFDYLRNVEKTLVLENLTSEAQELGMYDEKVPNPKEDDSGNEEKDSK